MSLTEEQRKKLYQSSVSRTLTEKQKGIYNRFLKIDAVVQSILVIMLVLLSLVWVIGIRELPADDAKDYALLLGISLILWQALVVTAFAFKYGDVARTDMLVLFIALALGVLVLLIVLVVAGDIAKSLPDDGIYYGMAFFSIVHFLRFVVYERYDKIRFMEEEVYDEDILDEEL